MDPIFNPARPPEVPAPDGNGAAVPGGDPTITRAGDGDEKALAYATPSTPSPGIATLFPTPRHRRPTESELAADGVAVSATFVRGAIIFTIVFILGMTMLIWYRWYPVSRPNSTIQFVGDETIEGAVATLSRGGRDVVSVKFDKSNNNRPAAWLVPGRYDLEISLDGRILQRTSVLTNETRILVDTLTLKSPQGQK